MGDGMIKTHSTNMRQEPSQQPSQLKRRAPVLLAIGEIMREIKRDPTIGQSAKDFMGLLEHGAIAAVVFDAFVKETDKERRFWEYGLLLGIGAFQVAKDGLKFINNGGVNLNDAIHVVDIAVERSLERSFGITKEALGMLSKAVKDIVSLFHKPETAEAVASA